MTKATHRYASRSERGVTHVATYDPHSRTATCTCRGFAQAMHCWHADDAMAQHEPCPECGSPMQLERHCTVVTRQVVMQGHQRRDRPLTVRYTSIIAPVALCTGCEFCLQIDTRPSAVRTQAPPPAGLPTAIVGAKEQGRCQTKAARARRKQRPQRRGRRSTARTGPA